MDEQIQLEKKKPYVIWNVDGKDYKLKLTTSGIIKLEDKLGTNILNILTNTKEESIPPLKVMLMVTHQAMQKYEHGIKEIDVINLFDKYEDEGGNQMKFLTEVFIPIYQVSGFFSKAQAETMESHLVEAQEQM